MTLNKISSTLIKEKKFGLQTSLDVPADKIFDLPERVLQFGTGVLLRGLVDYFIDKANKKGVFNGRVVVVKSTESSGSDAFGNQDGLFLHNIRGIAGGESVNEYVVNASISRVLSAKLQWDEILRCARNEEINIIVSNTTEVGITLVEEDITQGPPVSFPGKLTAYLYERYKAFGANPSGKIVIVPTELIVDNGKKLREIVRRLSQFNELGPEFFNWLESHTSFCNSLVDRIVPGSPGEDLKKEIFNMAGFDDDLLIMSEVYRLWAIEGNQFVKDVLSFSKTDKGVIIDDDITPYRERKLRLLNGTHTISVGLGYLAGWNTVGECMNDSLMQEFIHNVMHNEVVPALDVDRESAVDFANEVLDRFKNPFIVHKLLSITLQYTSKMNMRNSRTIINYYRKYNEVPQYFALGFAAYLLFMRAIKQEDGKYFGQRGDEFYLINDDSAAYFYEQWKKADLNTVNSSKKFVADILKNDSIWDRELLTVEGFSEAIAHCLFELVHKGVKETLEELVDLGEIEE